MSKRDSTMSTGEQVCTPTVSHSKGDNDEAAATGNNFPHPPLIQSFIIGCVDARRPFPVRSTGLIGTVKLSSSCRLGLVSRNLSPQFQPRLSHIFTGAIMG